MNAIDRLTARVADELRKAGANYINNAAVESATVTVSWPDGKP